MSENFSAKFEKDFDSDFTSQTQIAKSWGIHDDAEDVAQETLINAFLHFEDNDDSGWNNFLNKIGRNKRIDNLRAKRNQYEYVQFNPSNETKVASRPVEHQAITNIELERVANALGGLTESQRLVFIMRASGYSCPEIAEITSSTPKAVQALYNRANAYLNLMLGEK